MTDREPEDLHLPYDGRSDSDPGGGGRPWDAGQDLYTDQDTGPRVGRVRPPPKGLSRRDRHQWRTLEVARAQRESQAAEQFFHQLRTGWSKGFIRNPPRGLGRKGRRAWLAAERDATRRWWAQHRASDQDIDARSAGVLVVVLLMGAGLTYLAVFGRHSAPAAAGPATQASSSASPAPATSAAAGALPTAAALPSAASTARAAVPGAGEQADAGVSGAQTGSQPVEGRWQPTPAGGVTPVPAPTVAALDPAGVELVPQPVGPATAAQLATPVGAVTAWLARTCPSRWTDPYGADLTRGLALMTTAGSAAAKAALAADTTGPGLWKAAAADRQTRACGDFDVQLSADAPTAGGVAFVEYIAHRVVTAPGAARRVEQLTGARILVRQSDGRWLVDRPVIGG